MQPFEHLDVKRFQEVRRAVGPRSLSQLYATSAKRRDAETILEPGDVIEKITIPTKYAGSRQVYLKTAQREALSP